MRELDLLARQFSKESASLLRKDFSLYQRDLTRDAMKFIRDVERTAKKEKSGKVVLVAILYE
jgi:N-acetylmuramoyl-L-alanine amidase